jgi:signal transduction histidine kinase
MSFIEYLDPENLIVQILPSMDDAFLTKMKFEFLNTIRLEKIKRVFLNFSSVSEITSNGLSIMFGLRLFFKTYDIEVVAVNLNNKVSGIFKSVGLDQILDKEIQGDYLSVLNKNDKDRVEIESLKLELEYQKELYQRVTVDLETKLSMSNAELKTKNEQLQMLDKSNSIGELAAGVAHEFNNILGGILGYAQLAQAKKTPEIIEKAFVNIVTLSKRAEGITSGLLNFSRKKPVKVALVNFKEIIQSVLDFTQKQLENANIVVHTDWKEVELFYADANLLSQVILNLVINASHAMENGGDLYLSLYKESGFITFKIKDTGTGIKKANLNRIFLPFFTTKGALGGGNKPGTGLGLSISKSIVEMHEGKLEVESEEDKGATFIVSLPEKIATNEFKELINKPVFQKTEEVAKAKILVVDDEELIRSLLSAALSDKGHDILEGVNGEDGVKLYQSHKPDLVFLDILMPRMNGMDAYLEIRRINPNAKVVFITGQAGEYLEKVLNNLTKYEHVYLLRKPFEITELINVVNVALNSK